MPAGAGEDWSAGISASFAEPWAQGRDGVAGQRDGPFLASLAEDLDVRAAPEGDVGVAHGRQLRYPQAGLHGEGEQGPVAPSCPAPGAGRLQQRVGLVRLQEADERAVAALGRNREHPGDERGVLGMAVRGEGEPRAQRDQPGVAGGDAHAAFFLKAGEEPADRAGVEVLEAELGRLLPAGPGHIGEEQPEAVPVGGDGVRAGLALADQPLGEVLLRAARSGCPLMPRLPAREGRVHPAHDGQLSRRSRSSLPWRAAGPGRPR